MTQELFPEIQAAADALQNRITLTEAEITQLKEDIKARKGLVRAWRKALAAFTSSKTSRKKRLPNTAAAA
jgi:peptidoglycan hydrolase CwlO-like protein